MGRSYYASTLLAKNVWGSNTLSKEAFKVKIQGVKNEIDFLTEKLELIYLKKSRFKKKSNKPNLTPPEDDEEVKKLKLALEEAELVYSGQNYITDQ